jgi:hypothetical protein
MLFFCIKKILFLQSKKLIKMNAVKGVTFEKDAKGNDRYIRIDLMRHAHALYPLLQQWGIEQYPDEWENGLTSEEFLSEAKTILQRKFNGRNKVS